MLNYRITIPPTIIFFKTTIFCEFFVEIRFYNIFAILPFLAQFFRNMLNYRITIPPTIIFSKQRFIVNFFVEIRFYNIFVILSFSSAFFRNMLNYRLTIYPTIIFCKRTIFRELSCGNIFLQYLCEIVLF